MKTEMDKLVPKMPNLYELLGEAIEYGLRRGWSRAHKHDDKPTEALIFDTIPRCIMEEIFERFELIQSECEEKPIRLEP